MEAASSSAGGIEDSPQALLQKLVLAKMKLAVLQKEKRQLLEELHRQCLEGEIEPKKRLRPYLEKRKKLMKTQQASTTNMSSNNSTALLTNEPVA